MKGIARRNSWMWGMFVWVAKHHRFQASAGFWALRRHAPQGCQMGRGRGDQASFWKGSMGKSVHSSVTACLCPVSVSVWRQLSDSDVLCSCASAPWLQIRDLCVNMANCCSLVVWVETGKEWLRKEQIHCKGCFMQPLQDANDLRAQVALKWELRIGKKIAKAENLESSVKDDKETWK